MNDLFKSFLNIWSTYKTPLAWRIIFDWLWILVANRFLAVGSSGTAKLAGFSVNYGHRGSFYGMFKEIFIDQNYLIRPTQEEITIIDCGTNIGMSVLYFKLLAPNAKVIAFEPNPDTFNIIKDNVGKNNLDVKLYNVGLGKEQGELPFYTDMGDSSSQSASLTKHIQNKNRELKEIKVTIDKLSNYISGPIDVLKLDIEGAEGEVLEDLEETDKLKYCKIVFLEYHYDGENTCYPLGKLLSILDRAGFLYEIFTPFDLPFSIDQNRSISKSYKITAWKNK